jgi:hypothetical protein
MFEFFSPFSILSLNNISPVIIARSITQGLGGNSNILNKNLP